MEKHYSVINLSENTQDFHHRPFRLTPNEIDHPNVVISDFWERYTLQNFRLCFWDFFIKNLLMGSIDPIRTAEMYLDIERIIEATFLLNTEQQPGNNEKEPSANA
jgi:hypothetical protein